MVVSESVEKILEAVSENLSSKFKVSYSVINWELEGVRPLVYLLGFSFL